MRPLRLLLAAGILLGSSALIGASAASADVLVQIQPLSAGELRLDDPDGADDQIAITTVTPTGGLPDLVIGDVTAGIADPIPGFCQRMDPTIIRCPLNQVMSVTGFLGGGNDTWG